jgi:hypothetical protein
MLSLDQVETRHLIEILMTTATMTTMTAMMATMALKTTQMITD